MKRKFYETLKEWKSKRADRFALLIDGARRVGKSWIAEEFAKSEYDSYLLRDFSKASRGIRTIFEENLGDLDTFFMLLEAETGVRLVRGNALVVFDEVQEFPRAREAIKTLVADGRYHYLETGSLISVKKNTANIVIPSEELHLKMYPMDLEEFLWATGRESAMDAVRKFFSEHKPLGQAVHRRIMEAYRQYLVVGGMPQVVSEFVRSHDLAEVELGDDLGAFLRVEEGLRGLALLANLCYVFHLVFLSCFAKQRRDVRRHYLRLGQNASADSGGVPVADSGGVSGSAWPSCACATATPPSPVE